MGTVSHYFPLRISIHIKRNRLSDTFLSSITFLHDDELILRGLRCYLSLTLEVRWSRHLLSEPHTSYSAMELSFSLILLNSPQTYQIIVYASNAVATNTKKEQIVSGVVYKYFAHRRSLEP